MKRPLAAVGTTILLALAVFCALPAGWPVYLAGLFGAAAVCVLCLRGRVTLPVRVVLCALAAAALLFAACELRQNSLARRVCGRRWEAEFCVERCVQYEADCLVVASVRRLDGERVRGLTVRFYRDDPLSVGAVYSAQLRLWESAELAQTVSVRAYLLAEPARTGESWRFYLDRFGAQVRGNLLRYLGAPEGSLIGAMLTGERDNLPDTVSRDLTRSGIGHILAVSGLHVSILLGFAAKLCGAKGDRRFARFAATGLFGLLLALVYGGRPSVVRAVLMNWLVQGAQAANRESDPFTSLAAAALVILLPSPKTAGELGFLLSFSSCFALCVAAPALQAKVAARKGRPLGKAAAAVVSSCCVSVLTFPVLVLCGMTVSLVAPLANLLLLCFVAPMLCFGLVIGLFGGIGLLAPLFYLAALAAGVCAKLLLLGAHLFSAIPFAAVHFSDGFTRIWAVFAIAAVLVAAVRGRRARLGFTAACIVLSLATGIAVKAAVLARRTQIYPCGDFAVVCVGQGRAAAILRRQPGEAQQEELSDWCAVRFLPQPECVILLENIGIARPQTALAGLSVRPLGADRAEISTCGAVLVAQFGYTVTILDENGEPVADTARGVGFADTEMQPNCAVYIAQDGSYSVVREYD